MSFEQFSFPQVGAELGLTLADADLFGATPPAALRAGFAEAVLDGANLASMIGNEKARSEFVIAPVLFELRRLHPGAFGLFSGVELTADEPRGLNGVCDFLLTRSPGQYVVTHPILAIIEAENENLRGGLGQCIASMVAAQLLGESEPTIYGAVTSGSLWKFLRLDGRTATLDIVKYHIDQLGKLLGILGAIVAGVSQPRPS